MGKRISEMDDAVTLDGTEYIELVQTRAGLTKNVKAKTSDVTKLNATKLRKVASGKYFSPYRAHTDQAGSAIPINTMRAVPFTIDEAATITELCFRISTAAATGKAQVAVYSTDSNGNPTGTPVAYVIDVALASVGMGIGILSTAVTLQPGMYWFVICGDANAGTAVFRAPGPNMYLSLYGSVNASVVASAGPPTSLSKGQTYGSWPDVTGFTWTENTGAGCAAPYFRAA